MGKPINIFSLVIMLSLFGCMGNPYKSFYNRYYNAELGNKSSKQISVHKTSAEKHSRDKSFLEKDGLICIGESEFSSGMKASERSALSFGKKIGASYILLSKSYQTTRTGNYTLKTPTQTTTYHSGSMNVNSNGNYGTGSYSGTSTTYGAQTTNIPYSIDRYNYRASYFVEPKDLALEPIGQRNKNADALEIPEELNDELDLLLLQQTKELNASSFGGL